MNDRETIGTDNTKISDKVRTFYDAHPYPPPIKDLESYRVSWEDQKADFHLFWPSQPYREALQILIAGCGTSQAARYALRQPAARVVGIDFSSTSIRHSQALKGQYNLKNLELHQLPVERVHELEDSFDKIVCTGVLHHMPDPEVGLRALRQVLKPQGAMHLMLYAPYGRTGIYMLQEYCRRLGIEPSETEIQNLADTLMTLPRDHPLAHLLGQAPDFRTKTGLADALLNPQDRAYTVPQLFEFFAGADLSFGRWVRQAPYLPQCGAFAETPHSLRLAKLPRSEGFAAMELLRGTMVRHSAILYRSDRSNDKHAVSFDDDHWQYYIPICLPGTISVEEKLPPGATAVLINQDHTYTDIILPVDEKQVQLYDAIDGERTIAEIMRSMPKTEDRQRQFEDTRSFFERLWWYDQVVFDASMEIISSSSEQIS